MLLVELSRIVPFLIALGAVGLMIDTLVYRGKPAQRPEKAPASVRTKLAADPAVIAVRSESAAELERLTRPSAALVSSHAQRPLDHEIVHVAVDARANVLHASRELNYYLAFADSNVTPQCIDAKSPGNTYSGRVLHLKLSRGPASEQVDNPRLFGPGFSEQLARPYFSEVAKT